jgi:hypothetical protein
MNDNSKMRLPLLILIRHREPYFISDSPAHPFSETSLKIQRISGTWILFAELIFNNGMQSN